MLTVLKVHFDFHKVFQPILESKHYASVKLVVKVLFI